MIRRVLAALARFCSVVTWGRATKTDVARHDALLARLQRAQTRDRRPTGNRIGDGITARPARRPR